jgi:hypothetical protein
MVPRQLHFHFLMDCSNIFSTVWVRKVVWDKANLKRFCDICKNEVLVGHRSLGHLKKIG